MCFYISFYSSDLIFDFSVAQLCVSALCCFSQPVSGVEQVVLALIISLPLPPQTTICLVSGCGPAALPRIIMSASAASHHRRARLFHSASFVIFMLSARNLPLKPHSPCWVIYYSTQSFQVLLNTDLMVLVVCCWCCRDERGIVVVKTCCETKGGGSSLNETWWFYQHLVLEQFPEQRPLKRSIRQLWSCRSVFFQSWWIPASNFPSC